MLISHEEQIYLVDGTAPFFVPFSDGTRKNWSKAPLHHLVKHGRVNNDIQKEIIANLTTYCTAVVSQGYNAITFDDLAHLTLFDFYPYMISRTVDSYQLFFKELFRIASNAGLRIFITTDILFWNRYISRECRGSDRKRRELFREAIERLFDLFPRVDGIVTRIGETDGVDVHSHFKSKMIMRSAKQCNRWLKEILPLFEAHEKTLIFRTWSLGAFSVGDLIWNEKTELQIFNGITSENLIVSRKYGTADFFRYLSLSGRIHNSTQKHIVEFQARREYEGFGEFPASIGKQYEQYRDSLRNNPAFCGISNWIQTGGWSHFDRLSFLGNGSPWNEMNSYITIQLFQTKKSHIELAREFLSKQFPGKNPDSLLKLVSLFDELIDTVWYFEEYASREIWFRRLRVPPLLWIFWDTILVNRGLRFFMRAFFKAPEIVRESDKSKREKLKRIETIATKLALPEELWHCGVDTFDLLISIRHYYLGRGSEQREMRVLRKIAQYREKHPKGFQVEADFSPFHIRWITAWILFSILLRDRSEYRFLDRVLLIPLTGWLFPLFKQFQKNRFPELANRQAIGIELFFR